MSPLWLLAGAPFLFYNYNLGQDRDSMRVV